MNISLQVAAALDRRGITARIDGNGDVMVYIGRDDPKIRIRPSRNPRSWGSYWVWDDQDDGGHRHPRDDYEGLAEVFEKYLRNRPGFAGTEAQYRMDHMGMTFQEETEERLQRARARRVKNPDTVKGPAPAAERPPAPSAPAAPRGPGHCADTSHLHGQHRDSPTNPVGLPLGTHPQDLTQPRPAVSALCVGPDR